MLLWLVSMDLHLQMCLIENQREMFVHICSSDPSGKAVFQREGAALWFGANANVACRPPVVSVQLSVVVFLLLKRACCHILDPCLYCALSQSGGEMDSIISAWGDGREPLFSEGPDADFSAEASEMGSLCSKVVNQLLFKHLVHFLNISMVLFFVS